MVSTKPDLQLHSSGTGRPEASRSADSRPHSRDRRLALGYLAPGMTGFLIFIVVPVIGSIFISLFSWPLFGAPEFRGLGNYRDLITADPVFWTVLRNTIVFTVGFSALNLILSLALAVWLDNLGSWAPLFRVLFFIPVVVPMVANALVWRLMLDDSGVVNSFLGLVGIDGPAWLGNPALAMVSLIVMSTWQGIGYNVVILGAGLNAINPSAIEATKIDGANGWTRFVHVVFPLLSPSFFFCTIMTIMNAFKVFAQPYILTNGGPGDATNTLVLYLYRQGFSYNDLGYASAIAWVLFVFVMLVTALQFVGQKRWVTYDN